MEDTVWWKGMEEEGCSHHDGQKAGSRGKSSKGSLELPGHVKKDRSCVITCMWNAHNKQCMVTDSGPVDAGAQRWAVS